MQEQEKEKDKIKEQIINIINEPNDLTKQRPTIYEFKHVDKTIDLVFTDLTNTSYDVIENETQPLGIVKSYKDYINQALNPIVEQDKPIYGVARKFEPKTNTINRMKETIDNATNELKKSLEQQPTNTQPQEPQPQPQEKGE